MARSPIALPLSRSPWPSLLRPPNSRHRTRLLSVRFLSTTTSSKSGSSTFSYRIAASYSSKEHPLNLSQNLYNHNSLQSAVKLTAGSSPSERRSKRPRSGHDAFFVSDVAKSGTVALGVADGVGGWVDAGVDPADFSHSLCEYMASTAASYPESVPGGALPLRPVELLQAGYNLVDKDKNVFAGGSTACVGAASREGILEVANLGDSGYVHVSPFRLSHISTPQTHAFNTPYQLSKIPARMLAQMRLFGTSEHYAENPTDADLYQHGLTHGDVLVFATDGVWDNLSPEDALRIVSSLMVKFRGWIMSEDNEVGVSSEFAAPAKASDPSGTIEQPVTGIATHLATAITRAAKEASLDKRRDGPFAKEVRRHFPGENYNGGKPDDICTVVAVVLEDGR